MRRAIVRVGDIARSNHSVGSIGHVRNTEHAILSNTMTTPSTPRNSLSSFLTVQYYKTFRNHFLPCDISGVGTSASERHSDVN
jgi:hypothetical protein